MQNLPTPETYDKEALYMPWGMLLNEVIEYTAKNVPQGGSLLDLMCGTGYLLGKLKIIRPDIKFVGLDLNKEFVEFAQQENPDVNFILADAFTWENDAKYDAVICTAGLHHLPYEKHGEFIKKVSSLLNENGFAIIADPYIESYSSEEKRREVAQKLGEEYLKATVEKGAPQDVIEATKNLISNDVNLVEFKDSLENTEPYFKKYFSNVEKHKTWPKEATEYGDYYFILKNPLK